jgi:hypothetical protein
MQPRKDTAMTNDEDTVRRLDPSETSSGMISEQITDEQWLAIRREAGLRIDPETAEVLWEYAQTFDPYGVNPGLPEQCQQVGREYSAGSPGSDIWTWFGDLPDATRTALWENTDQSWPFLQDFGSDGQWVAMSVVVALVAARDGGIQIKICGGGLTLKAATPPPFGPDL